MKHQVFHLTRSALLGSAHNVSEIAYRSGFSHLSTFNRSFREAYGVTPGEAREENNFPRFSSSVAGNSQLNAESRMKHHDWFRRVGG